MKKFLYLFMSMLLVVSFAACKPKEGGVEKEVPLSGDQITEDEPAAPANAPAEQPAEQK